MVSFLSLAPDREVTNRQGPAELQQPTLAQKVGRLGLAHEVDIEIGRHRQRHRPQPSEQQQVEAEIDHGHQGRPRDRAARPEVASVRRLTQANRRVVEMRDFDLGWRVREVLGDPFVQFRDGHRRHDALPLSR